MWRSGSEEISSEGNTTPGDHQPWCYHLYPILRKLKGMAEFIKAADKGLYHSKETGRNKISLVNMAAA